MIRRALLLPKRPAVVLLFSCNVKLPRTQGLFHRVCASDKAVLGQYYGLPMVSMCEATFHLMQQQRAGFRSNGTAAHDGADQYYQDSFGALAPATGHRHGFGVTSAAAWRLAGLLVRSR